MIEEIIEFDGHPLIKATHRNTIEITRESILTQNGDCIIGISANKGCIDLSDEFKQKLKIDKTRLEILLLVNKIAFFAVKYTSLFMNINIFYSFFTLYKQEKTKFENSILN